MNRVIGMGVLAGLFFLAALGLADGKREKSKLATLMAEAHEGKTSPLGRVHEGLQAGDPAWGELGKDARAFVELSRELLKDKGEKNRGALAYKSASEGLLAAVSKKEKPAADQALKSLMQTRDARQDEGNPQGQE
jgi:hypothetical protein